jgi:hypothetical protein
MHEVLPAAVLNMHEVLPTAVLSMHEVLPAAVLNMHEVLPAAVFSLTFLPFLADPSGLAVYGVGLRPFACWDCGFESRRGHGCLCCACCIRAVVWNVKDRKT